MEMSTEMKANPVVVMNAGARMQTIREPMMAEEEVGMLDARTWWTMMMVAWTAAMLKPCRTSARASPKCKITESGRGQDRVAATKHRMLNMISRMTKTTLTIGKDIDEAHNSNIRIRGDP